MAVVLYYIILITLRLVADDYDFFRIPVNAEQKPLTHEIICMIMLTF